MFKVFIGWDPKYAEAAEVCKFSILKHSTLPVTIEFLIRKDLKNNQLYWRETDVNYEYESTKFLVPYLSQYQGFSLYVDPHFVFLDDVRKLFQSLDNEHSVKVVKHAKNKIWHNIILFNNAHSDLIKLTPEIVSTKTLQYLNKFDWVSSGELGELPKTWSWVVGSDKIENGDTRPQALNFVSGGPWDENTRHVEFGYHYFDYLNALNRSRQSEPQPSIFEHVPEDIEQIFKDILIYRVDPNSEYHSVKLEDIQMAVSKLNNQAVMAVEADTVEESSDKLEAKGQNYDPFLKSFIMGSGGQITVWNKVEKSSAPVVLRGVTKRKHMNACRDQGRDYYYIDTGYFGNGRKKTYHRITKNAMQQIGPVKHRPRDRLAMTGVGPRKFRSGRNILLAPPSQKLLMCYDIDLDAWLEETITMIKLYTDREIVVRNKQSRSVRQSSDTMEMALEKDIHCLVTFSSIAAVEAVLLGKPAIVLGPCAAEPVCSKSLKDIESPFIPTLDEVEEWAAHLAYCQFTELEMRDGTAWKILNDDA